MIAIKGIAKKPITDATAISTDVLSGKVFYNNGCCVGELSKDAVLFKRSITIPAGTYNSHTSSVKMYYYTGMIYETFIRSSTSPCTNISIGSRNISSDSMSTGYYHVNQAAILQEGNFQDTSYEPVGAGWFEKSGTYRKIIVDDYLNGGYIECTIYMGNINTKVTQYSKNDYDYDTSEMPLMLVITNNYYHVAAESSNGGFDVSSCKLPEDFHIDLFFRKRS